MMYGMTRRFSGRSRTSRPSERFHQTTISGHDYRAPVLADLLREPGVVEEAELASDVGFLAVHGGLEPGTAEVALAAARRAGASYYTVSQPDDLKWHIPTHLIDPADAPRLATFLGHVDVVVSVHGYWRR